MNDSDLDVRLARARDRLRAQMTEPPSLDDLYAAARSQRHRRTWVAIAATSIAVAAVAVTVPLLSSTGRHQEPANHSTLPPPTINVAGSTLHYLGDESWSNPVLDESDSKIVYIYADVNGGTASWGTYCGATAVPRIVAQSAASVEIAVARYAAPLTDNSASCQAIDHVPARLMVTLSEPLGTRSLIDAQSGNTRQVLDPAKVLKPDYVPAGYSGGEAIWADEPVGAVSRQYNGPGGSLTITIGPPGLSQPMAKVVEHTSVRGHPATVSYGPGFKNDIRVAWSEDSDHGANVYQTSKDDPAHPPLTVAELVRVADSLK